MFPGVGSKIRYLVISGIFVISVIIALQNFSTFPDRKVDTLIFFLVSLGIFSIFFGGIFLRYRKWRKMRQESYRESLEEGGIEEGRVYRDLIENEKQFLVKLGTKESYLDSRSPVFKIQGKALVDRLLERKGDNRINYVLNIRSQTFGGDQLNDVFGDLGAVGSWFETAVEYSPRTKHVWKIYKTEDI